MEFVYTINETDFDELYSIYSSLWWTANRSKKDLKIALKNSTLNIGLKKNNQLIGFARVLSDKAFKALILDVVIAPEFYHKGLGSMIMNHIIDHPELSLVNDFELYCKEELIPYYQKFGFEELKSPITFLRFSR